MFVQIKHTKQHVGNHVCHGSIIWQRSCENLYRCNGMCLAHIACVTTYSLQSRVRSPYPTLLINVCKLSFPIRIFLISRMILKSTRELNERQSYLLQEQGCAVAVEGQMNGSAGRARDTEGSAFL